MFLRNARTPPTRTHSVIFPEEQNINLFRRRNFNSHITPVIRFNFLMCHSKLAKSGAIYIPKTHVKATGCPEKGKSTLGGPYRQYNNFQMYLNDSVLCFDIAFSWERAASIFIVT